MAAAASTALLRSVAAKMSRRPGPGPASSWSRRFNSSPPTNNKDAQNKVDLKELELAKATFIKLTTGAAKFLAFGSLIYMCVVVKPAVDEFRESLDRKIPNNENFKEASESTQSSASSSK